MQAFKVRIMTIKMICNLHLPSYPYKRPKAEITINDKYTVIPASIAQMPYMAHAKRTRTIQYALFGSAAIKRNNLSRM